jgi:hypothetical protein
VTTITRDSLLTLEAYSKVRKTIRAEAIAHRKLRSVALGEHITLQFEDEKTIRRQIQEMLHIEKIFDEDGIQSELEAYGPLVPDDEKTSSVHFVRFELPKAAREAVRAGASVKLGCDHTNYPAHVTIAADTLASLAGDLR